MGYAHYASTRALQSHGFSHAGVVTAASARVYQQIHDQTLLLAFMDCFVIVGAMTLVAAPLVLLYQKLQARRQSA